MADKRPRLLRDGALRPDKIMSPDEPNYLNYELYELARELEEERQRFVRVKNAVWKGITCLTRT